MKVAVSRVKLNKPNRVEAIALKGKYAITSWHCPSLHQIVILIFARIWRLKADAIERSVDLFYVSECVSRGVLYGNIRKTRMDHMHGVCLGQSCDRYRLTVAPRGSSKFP